MFAPASAGPLCPYTVPSTRDASNGIETLLETRFVIAYVTISTLISVIVQNTCPCALLTGESVLMVLNPFWPKLRVIPEVGTPFGFKTVPVIVTCTTPFPSTVVALVESRSEEHTSALQSR